LPRSLERRAACLQDLARSRPLRCVGEPPLARVRGPLALIQAALALVGEPFALVRNSLALVGESLALVGDPIPFVCATLLISDLPP
jgi:hypothetical protein